MKNWIVLASLILGLFFPVAAVSADLKETALLFVQSLSDGKFEKAADQFDPSMKGALPAEKLQETWQSLQTQVGKFRRLEKEPRQEKAGPYEVVFVRTLFQNGALDTKIVFDEKQKITGLFFVPPQAFTETREYLPPYVQMDKFKEQKITVGRGEWALEGTLTVPVGKTSYPAVVFVHGSGPNDRDETIGPNKPFRDLAWGLATRGVASLRYDKRTKTHGAKFAGFKSGFTVKEETVDDAVLAGQLLRQRKEVEAVIILGHSLGGTLIPRIAQAFEADAYIIMAGATRPLDTLVLEQTEYIVALDGTISPDEKQHVDKIREEVAKLKNLETLAPTELILGVPVAYWKDLRNYQPAEAVKNIRAPLLVLQGGRDYQVTNTDFQFWKKSLEGVNSATFTLYPTLNHLFMAGTGKGRPDEYFKPGHVAEAVIVDIVRWVEGRK